MRSRYDPPAKQCTSASHWPRANLHNHPSHARRARPCALIHPINLAFILAVSCVSAIAGAGIGPAHSASCLNQKYFTAQCEVDVVGW
jgi:hypothetical protein